MADNITIICRLCLNIVETHNESHSIAPEMIELCLPEIHLNSTEHPVICETCDDQLKQLFAFKSKCLETEDKITNFKETCGTQIIDLMSLIKMENAKIQIKSEIEIEPECVTSVKDENEIKTEDEPEINVKVEEESNDDFQFVNCGRFGQTSSSQIDNEIKKTTLTNTAKSNRCVWRLFQTFRREKGYSLNRNTSVPQIAEILKDFAFNMKKKDGTDYKEGVIKFQWNKIAKMLQEKFYKEFGIIFDPFRDVVFKAARSARDAKRRQVRRVFGGKTSRRPPAFSEDEQHQILSLWDEDTPDGLQRKFFHIMTFQVAWGAVEATECRLTSFQIEVDQFGAQTGRIAYNPPLSSCQVGKKQTQKKWLVENKANPENCPVRLFHKLIKLRGNRVTTNRFFLTPNPGWNQKGSVGPFKNLPVGRNMISKWTTTAAEKIGIDVKRNKKIEPNNQQLPQS